MALEGALGDHDLLAFHEAHGHGHASAALLGEGADPCPLFLVQGHNGLPHREQARELRDGPEARLERFDIVGHRNEVARQQELLDVDPLALDLLLGLVLRAEALGELAFCANAHEEVGEPCLLAGLHLYDVPHARALLGRLRPALRFGKASPFRLPV